MFQVCRCRSSKHKKTPSSIEVYLYFKRLSILIYEPNSHQPHGLSDLFSRLNCAAYLLHGASLFMAICLSGEFL